MPQIRPQHVVTAAVAAAALLLASPAIDRFEGYSRASYPDVGNIWTACHGVAYVLPHHTYTDDECKIMDAVAKGRASRVVVESLRVPVSVPTLAAHDRFEYNIGSGNYRKSKTLRLTNAGDIAGGCRAMMNFFRAGGHDCRLDKGKRKGCYGLIVRRESEMNFCLSGVQ